MKIMKKLLCVVLTVIMSLCLFVPAFAQNNDLITAPIRFSHEGKLRIMHITDTHLKSDNIESSLWLIARACDKENPDVVVMTGDNATGADKEEDIKSIDRLMSIFEERKIPVAVSFGNHDSEKEGVDRDELFSVYEQYSCCIGINDGDMLPWTGTYVVPVLGSKNDELKFNLWVFDSGDYEQGGGYSNVSEEQVKWYKNLSTEIEKENGKKVYSLAFQHIVVPEIYDALSSSEMWKPFSVSHMYDDGKYYRFDKSKNNGGELNETPCCGKTNHGQFSAMVERGDVLGMFFGHDHSNTFEVENNGIILTNSLSTRFKSSAFETQYGYRMIEVDEDNTSEYKTNFVHWYESFSASDVAQARKDGDAFGAKLMSRIMFSGFFEKIFKGFVSILKQIF